MGCGGSKEEVATENTVITRRLLQKKSDATSIKVSSSSSTTQESGVDNGSNPVPDKAEPNQGSEPPPLAMEANGVAPTAEEKVVAEGKPILEDSPDHYFSSRKDEEAVAAVTTTVASEGAESKGEKVEADVNGLEEINEVKVEKGLVSEVGEEIAPKGEEGKLKGEDSADSKEMIVVEEKESRETNVELKNIGEGEIGTNSSSPH